MGKLTVIIITHVQSFLTGHCLWQWLGSPFPPQLGPTTKGRVSKGWRKRGTVKWDIIPELRIWGAGPSDNDLSSKELVRTTWRKLVVHKGDGLHWWAFPCGGPTRLHALWRQRLDYHVHIWAHGIRGINKLSSPIISIQDGKEFQPCLTGISWGAHFSFLFLNFINQIFEVHTILWKTQVSKRERKNKKSQSQQSELYILSSRSMD